MVLIEEVMAPQNKGIREYLKRFTNMSKLKRAFYNRITYEKSLPFKKRMIPSEFSEMFNNKNDWVPSYEKPLTRSEKNKLITIENKENEPKIKTVSLLNFISSGFEMANVLFID